MARQYTIVQRMDATLQTLRTAQQAGEAKPTLLLHACCGPCSSAVLELLAEVFEIHIYYYNPNIWPPAEYHRREAELEKFIAETHFDITVAEAEYQPADYYAAIAGLETEPERGNRCTVCYEMRMRRAAAYAKAHGFAYFATTLSISPHKDAARINAIGEALEAEYGVKHLPSDFKKHGGFARSLALSAQHGLYRQDYCGCEFSARR